MKNARFRKALCLSLKIIVFCCLQAEACYSDSYEDCTYLKENEASQYFGGRCFCYSSGTAIKWKDSWSTFQVHVTGADDARIVFPVEGSTCHDPEKTRVWLGCLVSRYWPLSSQGDASLDIPLVHKDVCFMLKARANAMYTLRVTGKQNSRLHIGLFVCGVILFLTAGPISRSPLFYYASGVSLGMVSLPVLMLLVLKRFIPKGVVFLALFCISCGITYEGLGLLLNRWNEAVSLYWKEVLGYLVASGLFSFAFCYKHGLITDGSTLRLIAAVLQGLALGLVFYGITHPPTAYLVMGVLLGVKLLPFFCSFLWAVCRQTGRLLGSFLGMFQHGHPRVKLLTEEEYREQGELYTRVSLEELRHHCNTPGFPTWEAVLRLRNPQRFAHFMRGGAHINIDESHSHDLQYGLGGAFYEDVIFPSGCNGVRRASSQLGEGDDISDDVLDGGEIATPPQSPVLTPLPPSSPPALLALPGSLPLCPYPTAPYRPSYPEPMELDEPF